MNATATRGRRAMRRAALRVSTTCFVPLLVAISINCIAHPARVSAQGGAGSGAVEPTIYLGLHDPAHGTLERLRAAGLIPDAWLDRRPLARAAAIRALREGERGARDRGLSVLAAEAAWRLRDLGDERWEAGTVLAPRERPLSLRWFDGESARMDAEFTLELAYDAREDLPPEYSPVSIGRGGIEIFGTAGASLGYAARYRQSTENRKGSIRTWAYAPLQTVAGVRGFSGSDSYTESAGHLSWDGRYLGVDLGLESPAWGPSPGFNLLLSGHAPSFGHVQGRLKFGEWLRYTMIYGSMRSGIIDSLRSYEPDEPTRFRELERSKYLVGHRIEVRPLRTLQVGLTEMVMVGDRAPEILYLVPTISIWDVQHYLNDPDNTMMSVDVNWNPARGPRVYGAVALDEWQIESTFKEEGHHNWVAFQVGGSWVPPVLEGRLHLWLEATRVMPNVYHHKYPINDWTHADQWLGFWTAWNSEVIEGSLTWLLSGHARATLWGRYAQKGDQVDRVEQYTIPPAEEFLFGEVRIGAWVGARLEWEADRNWVVAAEVTRAPAERWPYSRAPEIIPPVPASLGQEWQFFIRWTYNPF